MKTPVALAIALLVCTAARTQEGITSAPVDISREPHHRLLFENPRVRAFRLELQPNEATITHQHNNLYAYLSLNAVKIANEVRGRPPVMVNLEAGDVHTSKGGFTIAERNMSSEAAHLIAVEALKPDGQGFATPMGGFRFQRGGVR